MLVYCKDFPFLFYSNVSDALVRSKFYALVRPNVVPEGGNFENKLLTVQFFCISAWDELKLYFEFVRHLWFIL